MESNNSKARSIRGLALLLTFALVLVPLFQNCSAPKEYKFESQKLDASSGGGEGYGGKLFGLVSPSDPCADPLLKPSYIAEQSATETFLIAKDCQTLVTPLKVDVLYAAIPQILFYNNQTYRDETSNAPFTPAVIETIANIQAENMTLPASGSLTPTERPGWLTYNANGTARSDVSFSSAGLHRFTIRAQSRSLSGIDAKMELRIDGVAQGSSDIGEVTAEYTFEVSVTAGTHNVGISYTNDDNLPTGQGDRDLMVDWLKITR